MAKKKAASPLVDRVVIKMEEVKYSLVLTLMYSVVGLVYVGNFRD